MFFICYISPSPKGMLRDRHPTLSFDKLRTSALGKRSGPILLFQIRILPTLGPYQWDKDHRQDFFFIQNTRPFRPNLQDLTPAFAHRNYQAAAVLELLAQARGERPARQQ